MQGYLVPRYLSLACGCRMWFWSCFHTICSVQELGDTCFPSSRRSWSIRVVGEERTQMELLLLNISKGVLAVEIGVDDDPQYTVVIQQGCRSTHEGDQWLCKLAYWYCLSHQAWIRGIGGAQLTIAVNYDTNYLKRRPKHVQNGLAHVSIHPQAW